MFSLPYYILARYFLFQPLLFLGNPALDVGKRYNTLMVKNKSSVTNSLRNLLAKAQVDEQHSVACKLLGTVVNVIKRNSHKEKNPLQARYNIRIIFDMSLS